MLLILAKKSYFLTSPTKFITFSFTMDWRWKMIETGREYTIFPPGIAYTASIRLLY
jgi:hypothetical protein